MLRAAPALGCGELIKVTATAGIPRTALLARPVIVCVPLDCGGKAGVLEHPF